jgi:hypothetical protein
LTEQKGETMESGPVKAFTVQCSRCKVVEHFEMPQAAYDLWQSKTVAIQVALPFLTVDKREILISGYCSGCFDEITAPPSCTVCNGSGLIESGVYYAGSAEMIECPDCEGTGEQ